MTNHPTIFAVTYLENNRAGMTVYGFMMDRTWLHTVFGIELALLLWLLNKTIGIFKYIYIFIFYTYACACVSAL